MAKTKKPFDFGAPRIEYEDLDWLAARPWPKNPKTHDLAFLGEAFAENGLAEFPIFDEGTGKMVAGHGRVEKLVAMRDAGEAPPERVQVREGKWFIPVIRGMRFPKPGKHVLASNRGVELGGYDNALLIEALSGFGGDLIGTGFGEDELVKFLAVNGGNASDGNTDPDAIPEAAEPRTKSGDLWILGDHRLLCGDSTKIEDVARLMGKHRAVLMATDPPYGIDYTDETRAAASKAHGKIVKRKWNVSIDNDDKTGADIQPFLEDVFRSAVEAALIKKAAWYLWHAQMTQGFFAAAAAAAAAAVQIHRQIIWVKPSLLFGFGDYHWRHELAFYGWVKGFRPPFYGERNQTTIWEFGNETSGANRVHPNQKPVKLFEIPINNHTKPGEICYEPFSGSGTQIIAGQRMERRVFAMEVDPKYVDVAINRWEAFTGRKAKLSQEKRRSQQAAADARRQA